MAQVEKPADNTKVFGPPPPSKTDKNMLRSVTGIVRDVDGNPVPAALVYMKETKSGKERSIVAGPNGTYRFDDLHKSYDYQLRAVKNKLVSPMKTLSNFDTRAHPVMNLTVEPPAPPEGEAKK